jgi:hypothetical protein
VETFKFWARPALLAGLWIAAASFTLAELTTVVPSLQSVGPPAPHFRDAKQHTFRARAAQSSSRASLEP